MGKKEIEGTLSTLGRGVGFFNAPGTEDIRIEEGHLGTGLNGDTVLIRIHPTPEVVKVIKRAKTQFVGAVEKEDGELFLAPDDKRVYIDFLLEKGDVTPKEGDKVLVELLPWKNPKKSPRARVLRVLGERGTHEVEMESIILDKGIVEGFSKEIEEEAHKIKKEMGAITEVDISERRDMRDVPTFTIDPSDAKDFDDALSIVETEKGIEVGIHIADVGHYVRPGTKLDEEARDRAFSTYLVDRTIPMLPETLSNDLCSLNPNEDKRTFSAVFILDKDAKVLDRWFGKTLIRSKNRFSYENAQEVLNKKSGEFFKDLNMLNVLAKKLKAGKIKGGALDFDEGEYKFVLDDEGKPVKVIKKDRVDTHKLIEEFMLLANKEVARFISKKQGGGGEPSSQALIYRIHDMPDREKLDELRIFLKALGYQLGEKGKDISARAFNKLFMDIEGTSEESLIKTASIRSMAKARYSVKNIGHFGLGFGFYTHFTSPIRRYADLLVHRILENCLEGKPLSKEKREAYRRLAERLSDKEVSIAEAERDSIKYKQVEYMSERIGKEFDGIISGVSEWGIFVTEVESGAEGLVRIRDLGDDYFEFEPKKYRVVGKKSKKSYSLGQKIRIKVAGANLDRKQLDYKIV